LEDSLAQEYTNLEETPPLDTSIGALSCVTVGSLANDNVALLILDLGHEFGHLADCAWVSMSANDQMYCDLEDYEPSFSSGSWGASLSGTYTIPWTLKLTSLVFADQFSLLKQYVYLPSD
jgi:hypothetical protein